MNKILLAVILTLGFSLLGAQSLNYPQQIESLKLQLAYNPLDKGQRLLLAYTYMMNSQPEEALKEYQTVRAQDPASADAATGILWALNSSGNWKTTLKEAKPILKEFKTTATSDPGLILFHLATAEAALRRPLSARKHYLASIRSLRDSTLVDLPRNGLAWNYLTLGDFPRARKQFQQLKTGPQPEAFKPKLRLEFSTALKDSNTTILSFSPVIRHRSLTYRLKAEEILISGKSFRWNLQASIRKQLPGLDLRLGMQYLEGDDQRIYPGKSVSVSLQPVFYLGSFSVKPKIGQNLGVYKRFNVYQTDLGLEAGSGPLSLTAGISKLWQDNEAVGSDTEAMVFSFGTEAGVYREIGLGAYFGSGKMAWFTNSFGDTIDDFEPNDSYVGLSVYGPLFKGLSFLIYQQFGFYAEKTVPLSMLRMAYAF